MLLLNGAQNGTFPPGHVFINEASRPSGFFQIIKVSTSPPHPLPHPTRTSHARTPLARTHATRTHATRTRARNTQSQTNIWFREHVGFRWRLMEKQSMLPKERSAKYHFLILFLFFYICFILVYIYSIFCYFYSFFISFFWMLDLMSNSYLVKWVFWMNLQLHRPR